MNTLTKFRRFIVAVIGTLPLVLAPWSSNGAFAATSRSDISLTLVADLSKVRAGQDVTYTAVLTNHGPDAASFVDVDFSWPDKLNFVSMNCDLGISPDTPFCEYSAVPAGASVVSTFVATPAPGALAHSGILKVNAKVLFEVDCSFDPNCTYDPNSRNNSAAVTTRLIAQPVHH